MEQLTGDSGQIRSSLLFHSPLFTLTAPHHKVQFSVYKFIGSLFSIFNTQMYLNTFSQKNEEFVLTNTFNISV